MKLKVDRFKRQSAHILWSYFYKYCSYCCFNTSAYV